MTDDIDISDHFQSLPILVAKVRYDSDDVRHVVSFSGGLSVEGINLAPEQWTADHRLLKSLGLDAWPELLREAPDRLRRDGSFQCELLGYDATGKPRYFQMTETIRARAEDEIVVTAAFSDVSSYKHEVLELRKTVAELEDMIDNIPATLSRVRYRANGSREFLFLRGRLYPKDPERFFRLWALAPEQAGREFHPDDVPMLFYGMHRSLLESGKAECRFRHPRPDGTPNWLHLIERVVRREGSDIIVDGCTFDIAEEVSAKEAFERQREERINLERKLEEGRKREQLGQMAAGIAHEFNNLLGAIIGFADLLGQESNLSPNTTYFANRVSMAARRGKGLVAQVLTFARPSGVTHTRFDVSSLLNETMDLIRVSIPLSTRFHLEPVAGATEIIGDMDLLSQVLLNLCINAHDALGGQPGVVTVYFNSSHQLREEVTSRSLDNASVGIDDVVTWHSEEDRSHAIYGTVRPGVEYISLGVRDNGCGIEPNLVDRIFGSFFTTKDKGHGTGLGLTVVKNVVAAHRGVLLMETRPGHGTVFEVLIPRNADESVALHSEQITPPPPRGLGERLLIVEHDVDFADMLAATLEKFGYEVTVITDSIEAMEAFSEDPFAWDASFIDLSMPSVPGLEIVKAFRRRRSDMICFLCTGYAREEDDTSAVRAGARGILGKPIDFAELLRKLSGALSDRSYPPGYPSSTAN